MNPFLIKIIGIGKKITNTGLLKPLPLSGLAKEYRQLRESKFEFKKLIRFAAYLLGGIVLWGLITGKISFDDAIVLLKLLGI